MLCLRIFFVLFIEKPIYHHCTLPLVPGFSCRIFLPLRAHKRGVTGGSLVPVPTHKVPPFLWEGAIMNMTNSERRSTSVPRETNEQDQTTPELVTVASVSLSAL